MTDAKTLKALADKVEGLSGPCRETDAEIGMALKVVPSGIFNPETVIFKKAKSFAFKAYEDGTVSIPSVQRSWASAKYTHSIDAAVSLVPDGWGATKLAHYLNETHETELSYADTNTAVTARAKTEPLARTAAALRARASELD